MSLKKNFYEADMNFLKKLKVFRKTFLTPLKARISYSQCAEDLIVELFFKSQIKNGKNGHIYKNISLYLEKYRVPIIKNS